VNLITTAASQAHTAVAENLFGAFGERALHIQQHMQRYGALLSGNSPPVFRDKPSCIGATRSGNALTPRGPGGCQSIGAARSGNAPYRDRAACDG